MSQKRRNAVLGPSRNAETQKRSRHQPSRNAETRNASLAAIGRNARNAENAGQKNYKKVKALREARKCKRNVPKCTTAFVAHITLYICGTAALYCTLCAIRIQKASTLFWDVELMAGGRDRHTENPAELALGE